MSSRVRIYFYDSLEGKPHLGNHALKALVALYKLYAGRTLNIRTSPETLKRYVEENPFVPRTVPPEIPKGSAADTAVWIWKHLPTSITKLCTCVVTREGRANSWKYCKANRVKVPKKSGVFRIDIQRNERAQAQPLQGGGRLPEERPRRDYPRIGVWV